MRFSIANHPTKSMLLGMTLFIALIAAVSSTTTANGGLGEEIAGAAVIPHVVHEDHHVGDRSFAAMNAANDTTNNVTANLTATEQKKSSAEMTWESWLVLVCIAVLLIVLVADLTPVSSAMIFLSMFLYLATLVDKTELFVGFTNNGVLSIAILFIIVHPIAELPLVKKLVVVTLSGGSSSTEGSDAPKNNYWPLFKLCALSMILSSFVENTPHVAMFTPLVTKFCVDNGLAPSQFLLPMNYAVILGNYAVVGCSSNLVVSGLMEDAGMGQMDFFELAKIGAPQLILFLIYLVFMPQFLLPKNKGGLPSGGNDAGSKQQKKFTIKFRIAKSSKLAGKKYEAEFSETFPGASAATVSIVCVKKDGRALFPAPETAAVELNQPSSVALPASSASAPATPDEAAETTSNASTTAAAATAKPNSNLHHGDNEKTYLTPESICEEGDIVIVTGAPKMLFMAAPILGYGIITANDNAADHVANVYEHEAQQKAARTTASEPFSNNNDEIEMTTPEENNNNDDVVVTKSAKKYLYEVVLAGGCPHIGAVVRDRSFQFHYGVSVIALRRSVDGQECSVEELSNHIFAVGDTVLVHGTETFKKAHENNKKTDFLMVSSVDGKIDPLSPFIFSFPAWFPFGIPVFDEDSKTKATTTTEEQQQDEERKPSRKVVIFPPEYQYITLVIFVAIVVAAVFHLPLAILCLGGAILYVLLGIVSTSQAIKMIHLEVYVLVAMSFPLGIAVKSSGLASVIGELISDSGISGFALLLLISFISMIMTNLITNKAACQVMFPIIIEVYKAQEGSPDPLPAVMVATTVVVFALCTPYGIPPNVIVMGPGGYTGIDYLKFGLPITLMGTILTPIAAALVYGVSF